MIKLRLFFVIFITFASCNKTRHVSFLQGQSNLLEKSKNLKINYSNRNDILKLFGHSLIKDPIDKNIWYYIEVLKVSTIFGKQKIIKNNVLILYIDKSNGILKKKKFLDLDSMNQITIDNSKTTSLALNETFIKSLLKTSKKRIQNQAKELSK